MYDKLDHVHGPFYRATVLVCDEPTPHTGRIYPRDEVARAVAEFQRVISAGAAVGEFNPDNTSPRVRLDKTSHLVEKLWLDGNELRVDIQLLTTFEGEAVRILLQQNETVRAYIVGTGKVDGQTVHDYLIATVHLCFEDSEVNDLLPDIPTKE